MICEHKASYALMQPTFMPWIGWFAIMDYVDEFVVYNSAQFSYQSWHHRNNIKTPNGKLLITVPIQKKGLPKPIVDMQIHESLKVKKIMSSISHSYSKTAYYKDYIDEIEQELQNGVESGKLFDLNWKIIHWGYKKLGIETPIKFSSDLEVTGARGEYVANVGKSLKAREYISPLGAAEYLEEDKSFFDEVAIDIQFFQYEHPSYTQRYGDFTSHCCFLDLLFNEGPNSLEIIRSGIRM